jgi:hypothetical protein
MIVARHEMPGTGKKQPVPEGRLKMSGPARFFVNFALARIRRPSGTQSLC